ncbi:rho GTPase-activating protein 32 isoform X2 [Hippocampus zosterae]|uniref:rho GTPase-activating protein 32 isoform X2 n=1 Tax=Hippocampus zosterae TaxID=109293 RepID=UPI00223CEB89|nr:rho GTPase-activating protein 32 isoform X2 [Hippocampus zosterae]
METGGIVAAVIEDVSSRPRRDPGSSHILERDMAPFSQPNKDQVLPPASSSSPIDERQPQDIKARSDDIVAEPLLRSCVSTASMKVKNMKKLTFPRGHFPRLAECAHFHYETADFGNVELAFAEGQSEGPKWGAQDSKELLFLVQITCQARNWLVKRSYEDFRVLDKHLHLCIYDRRYSQLTELPKYNSAKDTAESVNEMLATYLSRFSIIADNKINCAPVLTWMEIDNKGNHLLVSEEASINVPAIAAAHVVKRYTAQATDELTFEVGDIVSVIDMPPKEDTGWWRGKHGFQVGFFPSDCVELINDKLPPSVQSSVPKPVCKKHGKLVTFLRSFMKSRPPPQKLRQRGILRERVFGCDLGEHLHSSEHEVPQVVKSCAEFIEKHGVVDGIYRLSGISSNIQKLRHEFDSEQIPDLSRDVFRQDIHSVGSLCKLYFRELPNPLLTYQLYDRFSEAVSAATDEERLVKIHNVIQQLPPPHYRTLEYLMRHLSRLATFSTCTNMHTKNLAIVWAPNLLRSRQIESACFSGTAAFMEVRIQSVVVEFILNNTEALFSTKLNAVIRESAGNNTLSRPKSLLVCSPSTKLLSLEEAQARTQAQLSSPATTPCLSHSDYIEVGEGPGALMGKFHTVIELPLESVKRAPSKAKKSPVGNWLSFFHLGKSHSVSKRKLKRHPSEPNEIKSITLPGGRGDSGTLRSAKSEESLTSLHNLEGEPPKYQHVRPLSTSEAVTSYGRDDSFRTRSKPLFGQNGAEELSPPLPEDDIDLYPPVAGMSSLDFDPMSFQCSLASATPRAPRHREGHKLRRGESDAATSPSNVESPAQFRKAETREARTADGKEPRAPYRHCSPRSLGGQASAQTDSAQTLPDPDDSSHLFSTEPWSSLRADRLMSSVSILPPHPSPTSAARKLALALAESAQKASGGSQRGRNPPARPLQRREAQDRPARPSALDLKPCPRANAGSPQWQTPLRLLYSQAADGPESNFTPNVSPLGSGSLDSPRGDVTPEEPTYQSVGVSTPTEHICSPRSPSTSPVYANTDSINIFNFRAVLAETSVPASIDEVLPRPFQSPSFRHYAYRALGPFDDVYRNTRHQPPRQIHCGRLARCPQPDALPRHLSGPRRVYRQSSGNRCTPSESGPALSPQYRRFYRGEHFMGPGQRQQGHWQRCEDGPARHPAIRRARSFHAPQTSRYEMAATEVPPPDLYPEQQVAYQRLLQRHFEDLHVQQMMYNPYPDLNPRDCSRYPLEPFQRDSIRHGQPYRTRSTKERAPPEFYYSPRYSRPLERELFMDSEDMVENKNTSPYDSPVSPAGSTGREIMHIRSKSDPGNGMLSAGRRESQSADKALSPTAHQPRRVLVNENASQQQQAPLRKIPSLPEKGFAELGDRSQADPFKKARAGILRRPERSQSTRENRHQHHQRLVNTPVDDQHAGSFSSHPNRRTRSTKVRPAQSDHMAGGFSAFPRPKHTRSTKAGPGYSPAPDATAISSSSAASPYGNRLLSKALAQEAFYQSAVRTHAGVHE